MKKVFRLYANAFGGLSGPAWMLSLIMLINRSGSMVIPFLSVYLTDNLDMTVKDAGTIMTVFGLGSMAGSFLGGWLTDRIGQFRVQLTSLVLGGMLYFVLAGVSDFFGLAAGVFVLSMVADSLRPANAASISMYARPENLTRAFSLNRMAVNLGFSIGPALGGLLASISYTWLFAADGITSIAAGFLFYFYFRKRKTYGGRKEVKSTGVNHKPVWKDVRFLVFCLFCTLFAVTFFQIFSTLPLYYRQVFMLSETSIGILLGLNGLVVFFFEMLLVYLIGKKVSLRILIVSGSLLIALSFILLNLAGGKPLLYIAMAVLSFAEILAMPYMVTYTVERSGEGNRGSYMGFYSLAYAAAFVLAPFAGTRVISAYGFETLWWLTAAVAIITGAGFWFTLEREKKPREELPPAVADQLPGV